MTRDSRLGRVLTLNRAHRLPWAVVLTYGGLYIVSLLVLYRAGIGLGTPLAVLLIVGVAFSGLAWWITRGTTALAYAVRAPQNELALLGVLLVGVAAFITWGIPAIRTAAAEQPAGSLVEIGAKLTTFVVLPLGLLISVYRYKARSLVGLEGRFWRPDHVRVALVMAAVLVGFQLLVGGGRTEMREAGLGGWLLVAAIPVALIQLVVEVGIVEELFFRVLLQSRLAAFMKSEIAGVVTMALVFGLAHAPGLYLRPEATMELVGSDPSLTVAVAYSIAVVSVTGFMFGILWARTRNLLVLVLVHAAGDLVPNLTEIARAWGMLPS